jgi:dipeptidyl aminopeptidase/acylaminoacyl peptidase
MYRLGRNVKKRYNLAMSQYSIQDFLETKTAWAPSWSPDATKLLYISNLTGVAQAYLKDLASGEVRQLTDGSDPIEFAVFLPTENQILFGHSQGGNERTQIGCLDPATGKTDWLLHNYEVIHRFGTMSRDSKLFSYSTNERNGKDFDIYVFDIDKKQGTRVFAQGGWCRPMGFSPDNKWMVVRVDHAPTENQLMILNLESGEVREITPKEGKKEHGYSHWKPDSSGFYFKNNDSRDLFGLDYYDMASGKISNISDAIPELPKAELEFMRITKEGDRLMLGYSTDGFTDVWFMETASGKVTNAQLKSGVLDGFAWTADGKRLAFEHMDAVQQSDIWIYDCENGSVDRATESPRRVPAEVCRPVELIKYKSFDGREIPALLYMPKQVEEKKCPVIVNVHGGPEGQSQPGWNGLMQYYVSMGWAVVLPNIRGSSGYGKEFMAADDKGKRWDAIKDIEWLNQYLRSREEFDPSRLVIMGGSYGGYMTLAGLAFQPELWAAGVDIVGMSNLVTFLQNTSVWRRAMREAEYGALAEDMEVLEQLSPMRAVKDIKAPLFVIHGANDPRVPLSEAEQIVKTVVDQGGVAELLVYHDEGHGLAKLQNRLDAYPKVADFLTKHVIEKR